MLPSNFPTCASCATPIKPGQGFSRLNGRDDKDGLRHIYAEDCVTGLLDLVEQLKSENATLRYMLDNRKDVR